LIKKKSRKTEKETKFGNKKTKTEENRSRIVLEEAMTVRTLWRCSIF
jgi:hypothetical protein